MKIDFKNKTIIQQLKHFYRILQRFTTKNFKLVCSWLLPKKIFLRLIGGGGYFCLATYKKDLILHP